jgi:hypothetical protein
VLEDDWLDVLLDVRVLVEVVAVAAMFCIFDDVAVVVAVVVVELLFGVLVVR